MSISRDEFDQLVTRVDSLERQNRAIISLLTEQVVTIVPAIDRAVEQIEQDIRSLEAATLRRFDSVDRKLDEIIGRLP